MTRRLTTLLIVAGLVLGGAACPRGALACGAAMQSARQCCVSHVAVRASCCCTASHRPAPLLKSPIPDRQDTHPTRILAPSAFSPITAPGSRLSTAPRAAGADGLPRPDTLVARRSCLLL